MKKVGELMKEIGFNPNGSDAVKEAFVKHLIKQSTGANVQTPTEKKIIKDNPDKFFSIAKTDSVHTTPTQLSFEFDVPNVKKKSAI